MFFKQQECTGRWISVESEAVCKTAKTQTEMTHFLRDGCSTRGHTLHVMEVRTSWSQRLERTVLERLAKVTSHHLPSKCSHNCKHQKLLSAPLAHLSFICSNTGKRENPPMPGSTKRLLTHSVAQTRP